MKNFGFSLNERRRRRSGEGGGWGVIGCRFWTSEKQKQACGITQDCSCFQVHLAFGNGYRVLPFGGKKGDFPVDYRAPSKNMNAAKVAV